MKIDAQSMTFITQFATQTSAQDSGFDGLLDPTIQPRQADDYYWQQQNQLQPSAITFNSNINEPKAQITIEPVPKKAPITSSTSTETSPFISKKIMPIEPSTSELSISSKLDVQQFITALDKTIEHMGNITEHTITNPFEAKTKINTKPMLTPTSTATFKNYQLYLNDNQVELTLNTTLSKPQITELQQFIQQWLSQKGYTLKQLMINGVKQ